VKKKGAIAEKESLNEVERGVYQLVKGGLGWERKRREKGRAGLKGKKTNCLSEK